MMRSRLIGGLFAVLLVPGCATTIGRQDPHPNIALTQQRSVRLVLASSIEDRVSLSFGPVSPVHVNAWRETLEAGFYAGFERGSGDDLTLTLDEVRLELGARDEHSEARIQYKATLTSANGPPRRSAGTVTKGFLGVPSSETQRLASDITGAVEAMYEQIARDLLSGAG
jgi:hypothetical protein